MATFPIIEANVAGCEIVRCAVVGHVEWVEFARVPQMPLPGAIVHASETRSEPAGGGAVVARQLALLAGRCELFTALGSDDLGRAAQRRLAGLGVDVHVQWGGERTITVLGEKLLPHGPLPLHGYDLVFFVSGVPEVLREARSARFLAATARELPALHEAGVPLDLLVGSLNDPGEWYDGSLEVATVALTNGADGGTANDVPYAAVPAETIVDTYGAGDSFAAALAFGLARGDALGDAVALAARAGSAVLAGPGPYSSQLALEQ